MSQIGVKGIEPLLRGADLEGAVVLCEAPESPERSAICYQFIREGLASGERVLIVLSKGSPETVKKGLSKIGVSVDGEIDEDRLIFVTPEGDAGQGTLDARKLPAQISGKLIDIGAAAEKRVLVTGLNILLEPLPQDKREKMLSDLTGELRARAILSMVVLDPAGMTAQEVEGLHQNFDGVLKIVRDSLAEGFMIGAVDFEGVEREGIFLPLRKSGEEIVAGFPAMSGAATEACPECGFQVLPGFDVCPRCKADLKKARAAAPKAPGVFDYLEKLGTAAGVSAPIAEASKDENARKQKLQEFLQSMGAVEGKDKEVAKQRLKELARTRRTKVRPVKMPGRTNGLTNGLVKATGKVNGLGRSATTGMVNGTGRTNGLVNGLAKARRGMTNGLTNGNGFTNGLGSKRYRAQATRSRWKIVIIPFVGAALLFAPLLSPAGLNRPYSALNADGNFSEWSSAIPLDRNTTLSADIDLIGAGILSDNGHLGVYFQVAGSILTGNPSGEQSDMLQAFIDSDNDVTTGYSYEGIGADYVIQISGENHQVIASILFKWSQNSSRDDTDWSNWERKAQAEAAIGSGQDIGKLEAVFDLLGGVIGDAASMAGGRSLFRSESWNHAEDLSDFAASSGHPSLEVIQTSVAPETVQTGRDSLLQLDMRAAGGEVTVEGVDFTILGTAAASDVNEFRALDESGNTLGTESYAGGIGSVTFTSPLSVGTAWTRVTIQSNIVSGGGKTIGLRLPDVEFVGVQGAAVSLFNGPAARQLSYIGQIPAGVVIDGAFSDWAGAKSDPANDPGTNGDKDIDVVAYDAYRNSTRVAYYTKVQGKMMRGTVAPVNLPSPQLAPQPPDHDHDTVPDDFEAKFNGILPYDFDNDNVSDASQDHDIDGDGVQDYPFGPDYWLNTTIPLWYGVPYGGKFVSIYIGPEIIPPPNHGEDTLRVFIDTDGSPGTGYSVGGVFADYMVQITGKNGGELTKQLMKFTGPTPLTWSWTAAGGTTLAVEGRELEGQVDIPSLQPTANVTVVFDFRSWRGGQDQTNPARSRAMTRSGDGGLRVSQSAYDLVFPADIQQDAAEYRDEQGFGLRWKMAGISVVSDQGTVNPVPLGSSSLNVQGSEISYVQRDSLFKTTYLPGADRLKEELTFPSPPSRITGELGTLSIRFDVSYLGGVVPEFDGGSGIWLPPARAGVWSYETPEQIHFSLANVPAFTLDAPFAVDARGARVRCVSSLTEGATGAALTVRCPLDWLASAQYPVTVDPTILMNGYRGENFGYSLATGDFNGDGKQDLLVGAPYNSLGGPGSGRAYVYLGGTNMDNIVDLEIPAPSAGEHFGWSVAAGDVDNNGFAEMIIGAPDYNGGDGRVYIVLGASTLHSTIDYVLVSKQSVEKFGMALAVGNFNGDSYQDILIGAPFNDTGGAEIGSAYILFGASSIHTTLDRSLHGVSAGEYFGSAVGVGDFNGDGYSDAAVGAPKFIQTSPSADGRVGVFFGGANMDAVMDVNCTNGDSNEELGTSVSSANYNLDAYDDLYAGGPSNSGTASHAGRVEVFKGGAAMDGVLDSWLPGPGLSNSYYGMALAKGKISNDAYPDMAVGSPRYRVGVSPFESGRFDICWNGSSATCGSNKLGEFNYDHFGYALAIGDVNSSATYSELIVGAIDFDIVDNTSSGKVYVFNGGNQGFFDTTPDLLILGKDPGSRPGEKLGYSVTTGDFNGDGKPDVLAGAPFNGNVGANSGVAFIFFGKPFAANTYYGPDMMLQGHISGEGFGWNVSAGDVNGDGYDDAIIGAPYNSEGGTNTGRAYVYYGGAIMNNVVDVDIAGQSAGEMFGWDVAVGNVNGDQAGGRPLKDIVVGAPQNGTGKGRVYIYFGSTSFGSVVSTPNVKLYRGDTEAFGSSVRIGNFNLDGYDDILVGAPTNTSSKGAAYVYNGCGNWANCFRNPDSNSYFTARVASKGGSDTTTDLLADAQYNDATNENNPPNSVTTGDGWYTAEKGARNTVHFSSMDITGMISATVVAAQLQVQYSVVAGGYTGNTYVWWKYSGAGWAQTTIQPLSGDFAKYANYTLSGVDTRTKVSSVQVWFQNNDTNSGQAVDFDFVWVNVTVKGQQPANVTLAGQVNTERFGGALATGDIDGDTAYLDDAIVGAPFYSDTNDTGAVYIYAGSTIRATANGGTITTPTKRIFGPFSTSGKFGWSIASGNVNNDAYDDLMIGAPLNNSGMGAVYWYYGPTSSISLKFTSNGEQSERRGWAVASADLVTGYWWEAAMGAPWFNSTSTDGRVVIVNSIPEFSDAIVPAVSALVPGFYAARRRASRRNRGTSIAKRRPS